MDVNGDRKNVIAKQSRTRVVSSTSRLTHGVDSSDCIKLMYDLLQPCILRPRVSLNVRAEDAIGSKAVDMARQAVFTQLGRSPGAECLDIVDQLHEDGALSQLRSRRRADIVPRRLRDCPLGKRDIAVFQWSHCDCSNLSRTWRCVLWDSVLLVED